MKTLGLIGGISYHSSAVYYNVINQQINERIGNDHTAKLLLYSVNYAEFKQLQTKSDWKQIEIMLSDIAITLENAGADCIMLCCNTAHLIADDLAQKIKIPFLHIAEATARVCTHSGINKVGLIGTKFTMEKPFFKDKLKAHGIDTLLPDSDDCDFLHTTILSELSKGILNAETKRRYLDIIDKLASKSAQAIILGCTEIGLLLKQTDCDIKLLDTTILHARAAVDFALSH